MIDKLTIPLYNEFSNNKIKRKEVKTMLDFSTIFNSETLTEPFLEGVKTTIQIFIELLKMPLIPIDNNTYIPFGLILIISVIPTVSKKSKRY